MSKYDPFALAPAVQKAYDDFVSCSTLKPRPVNEWLQPYLNWRWEMRKVYPSLTHLQNADEKDRALLIKYNNQMIADAEFLDYTEKPPSFFRLMIPGQAGQARIDAMRGNLFEDEARTVLAIARAASPTKKRLHALFDLFVHDSLAGFDHYNLELSGYWRYRRGFLGSESRLVVENDRPSDADRAVA